MELPENIDECTDSQIMKLYKAILDEITRQEQKEKEENDEH